MNRDAELRMIVQKVVHGSYRSDLLDRLLLGLRSMLPSGSCLRDIADFVAHPDQRDRGPLHQHISRIKSSQDFLLRVRDPEYEINKKELVEVIHNRYNIDNTGFASKNLGISQSEIDRQIPIIKDQISKSTANIVDDCVSPDLFPLFEYYLSHHLWSTVYYDDKLFSDLTDELINRKILANSEREKFNAFKHYFILHVCHRLHLTQVIVDNVVFTLYVGRELKYHSFFETEMPHVTVWATHGPNLQYAICLLSTQMLTLGAFDDVANMFCDFQGFVSYPVDFDGNKIFVQGYTEIEDEVT